MELIYIHIDNYRNFEEQGISFSDKFVVNYDKNESKIYIEENNEYVNLFTNNIKNISAIVGRNSSGKTSLIELMGKSVQDRISCGEIKSKYNAPFSRLDLRKIKPNNPSDFKQQSTYFIIYFYKKDNSGSNIYVVETNDVGRYESLFKECEKNMHCEQELWWTGVFYNIDGKMKSIVVNQRRDEEYNIGALNSSVILTFRQSGSINRKDYITHRYLQREVFSVVSNNLFSKLKFLIKQMNENGFKMYKDNEYLVTLAYPTSEIKDDEIFKSVLAEWYLINLSKEFKDQEKAVLNYMYNQVCFVYSGYRLQKEQLDNHNFNNEVEAFSNKLKELKNYDDVKDYYFKLFDHRVKFSEYHFGEAKKEISKFKEMVKIIEVFLNTSTLDYEVDYDQIVIKLNKESNIDKWKSFFEFFNGSYSFDCYNLQYKSKYNTHKINYLSDGELNYLDLFSTLFINIEEKSDKIKNYIILFDEIERCMHPEMCRNIISSLVDFLAQFESKSFQLVISSHSPFIISDIKKSNVIHLKKQNNIISANIDEDNVETFGQNIYRILKKDFFMDSTIGEYSKNKIIEIYKKLSNIEKINEKCVNYDSINDIKKVINCVGEKIIKEQLLELLDDYIVEHKCVDKKIQYYKDRIKELARIE